MINTQLHNQLIDIEIARRVVESKKRIQGVKTEVLKERLRQSLYIAGFIFVILLMLVALLWLLPNKSIKLPSIGGAKSEVTKDYKPKERNTPEKKKQISKNTKKLFSGVEYVKEKNYVYKRIYKDGRLIEEEKLAPTIRESKKLKKENIPQFSTLKKSVSAN